MLNKKTVLVVGSGGREHAIVWKLSTSPMVDKIYCLPGNGGISELVECYPVNVEDVNNILKFAVEKKVDYTIIGPESSLVAGVADVFKQNNLAVFGPVKDTAKLEGSKVWAKEFMTKYNIPTAAYKFFDEPILATEYIEQMSKFNHKLVVKVDGLAAGKGVIVCDTTEQAKTAVDKILIDKQFGTSAGNTVVIENRLVGEEATVLAFCDGKTLIPLLPSQDHKRVFDNDEGPNTGGMGAYAPAPIIDDTLMKKIKVSVFDNFLYGLERENLEYNGIIYFGLIVTADGPQLLEFNCRFGDAEAQVVLPTLEDDLVEIIDLACNNKLSELKPKFSKTAAVCVVLASGGYPSDYSKGVKITGLEKVKENKNVVVFHAGTKVEVVNNERQYFTSGGRVLGITGRDKNIKLAIDQAYSAVNLISFDKMHFRKDIGAKALKRM